jgi:hypothetical protein
MNDPGQDAKEFILFCDGIEEAGYAVYASRGRVVARELLATLDMLAAERSARVAIQERCKAQEQILANRAYEATG